jgi:hypothetical protein
MAMNITSPLSAAQAARHHKEAILTTGRQQAFAPMHFNSRRGSK